MSGITALAIENKDMAWLVHLMQNAGIAHYELAKFFELEQFTTLEEFEAWWEDK